MSDHFKGGTKGRKFSINDVMEHNARQIAKVEQPRIKRPSQTELEKENLKLREEIERLKKTLPSAQFRPHDHEDYDFGMPSFTEDTYD